MASDPCFTCPLPDCDEDDRRCALKRAHSAYSKARRQRRLPEISQDIRDGYSAWFTTWRLERDARRSERPSAHSNQPQVTP